MFTWHQMEGFGMGFCLGFPAYGVKAIHGENVDNRAAPMLSLSAYTFSSVYGVAGLWCVEYDEMARQRWWWGRHGEVGPWEGQMVSGLQVQCSVHLDPDINPLLTQMIDASSLYLFSRLVYCNDINKDIPLQIYQNWKQVQKLLIKTIQRVLLEFMGIYKQMQTKLARDRIGYQILT